MGDGDRADEAAVVRDRDAAPVGQIRDGELGDPLERLLVVERGSEDLARLGQQARAQLGTLHDRHVLDDVDDAREGTLGVRDRRDLVQQPALLAGRADDVAHELGWHVALAVHEGAHRQLVDRHALAVLVEDVVARHQVAGLRRVELRRIVDAEHGERRAVGVQRATVEAHDGDGIVERAERDPELALGVAQVAVEAGVVQCQRRTSGEHLEEVEIALAVAAAGDARDRQRERAEHAAAAAQRDDRGRALVQTLQQLTVGGVVGVSEALCVESLQQLRLVARRDRRRPGARGSRRQRPGAHTRLELGAIGVRDADGDPAQLTIDEDVEDTVVGHRGDEDVRQPGGRLADVQRAVINHLRHRAEDPETARDLQMALALRRGDHSRDAAADDDDESDREGGVEQVVVPEPAEHDATDGDRSHEDGLAAVTERGRHEGAEDDRADHDRAVVVTEVVGRQRDDDQQPDARGHQAQGGQARQGASEARGGRLLALRHAGSGVSQRAAGATSVPARVPNAGTGPRRSALPGRAVAQS